MADSSASAPKPFYQLRNAEELNALATQWAEDNGWSFGQALELAMWQEMARGLTCAQIMGQDGKPVLYPPNSPAPARKKRPS